MRFVETPICTEVITALLDDESYRGLQSALIKAVRKKLRASQSECALMIGVNVSTLRS